MTTFTAVLPFTPFTGPAHQSFSLEAIISEIQEYCWRKDNHAFYLGTFDGVERFEKFYAHACAVLEQNGFEIDQHWLTSLQSIILVTLKSRDELRGVNFLRDEAILMFGDLHQQMTHMLFHSMTDEDNCV